MFNFIAKSTLRAATPRKTRCALLIRCPNCSKRWTTCEGQIKRFCWKDETIQLFQRKSLIPFVVGESPVMLDPGARLGVLQQSYFLSSLEMQVLHLLEKTIFPDGSDVRLQIAGCICGYVYFAYLSKILKLLVCGRLTESPRRKCKISDQFVLSICPKTRSLQPVDDSQSLFFVIMARN